MADNDTYDFIVTGAGSAGCVVAARLSESGRHRVLLLEAGPPDSNPWIHIPLGFAKTYVNPRVNWKFETAAAAATWQPPAVSAARQDAGRVQFDQRHGLYPRQPRRLRRMAAARLRRLGLGFRAAVLQEGGEPDARRQTNSTASAARCTCPTSPASSNWPTRCSRRACRPAFRAIRTSTARKQEGCGYYQTTTSKRRRWSTAKAYLEPARGRANLVVADRRACHARADREQPRHRRRIPHAARPPHRACPRRGHRVGRRLRFAAASAAVRPRPGAASAGHRHSRGARHAGRRRQPARPFQFLS